MTTETTAAGLAYDPQTNDWTKRVEFTARTREEALDWIKFQKDWMKELHIVEPDDAPEEDDDRAELTNAGAALEFITAGKAIFTIVSKKTGTRFTYKVSRPQRGGNLLFVGVLSGADNNSDYTYLGFIPTDTPRVKLVAGNKGRSDAPSYRALDWTLRQLARGMPEDLEIWHEGRCGRCNRRLTVPSSIETGFGPECANKVGL